MADEPFVWGEGGSKDTVSRRRRLAEAMMKSGMDYSPVQHWTQGLARVAQSLVGGYEAGQADKLEKTNTAKDAEIASGLLSGIIGGGASPAAAPAPASGGTVPTRTTSAPNVSPEIKDGIVQTASALGIDPVDLATTISYETGGTFDPTKAGPTTKWGQHRGLIQFGEPQAKQHGVDWSNPVASQLGPNGAVASYLKAAGVKPGMGLLDVYSAINAGAPGLYNRSDTAAGGAPGTVRDKVEQQMQGHRAKAEALLRSAQADMPAQGAMPVEGATGQAGFAVPGQPAPMDAQTFNGITSAAAPLDPAFQAEGASQPWMGTALAPLPPAAAPMVAQGAPMPPPRPADLAMASPQADMPAPGAVQAMGQAPQAMPDLSNSPDGGIRQLQVLSEQDRQNQPAAPQAAASPISRIVQALGIQGQPEAAAAAPASPAKAQIAAALTQSPNDPLVQALTNPSASENTKRLAMILLTKKIESQQRPQWTEQTLPDGSLAQRNSQTGEMKIVRPGIDPLDREGKLLDVGAKKRAAAEIKAPTTKVVKQSDGSEVALQWNQDTGEWVPLKAPQGGNAVTGSPSNPYALPGKPTEGQSKDAGFAGRMVESHNLISGLESVGTDKVEAAKGAVPYIGNSLVSADKQKFEQAKRNFVTATLRKESGAAISPGEFATEEKKYFPQVGDSPEVIQQKREARELAIEGVMAGAGSGYKVPETYKPQRGQASTSSSAATKAAPDRAALEAEARRRGLIK